MPFICIASLILVIAITSCSTTSAAEYSAPAEPLYRVAVVQFAQETNAFSPVLTTHEDFEAIGIYRGAEVYDFAAQGNTPLTGFMRAISKLGKQEIEIVPLFSAMAMSGGPIERDLYESFKAEMISGLASAVPLDGVYLSLHGSMGVEGIDDPEGDLLTAVRNIIGLDAIVGVTHDLHANLTARRAELADFIVGYKTNPHRDFEDTGYRAGRILIQALRGEIEPVMVVRKMRLLKGGGINIDFLRPMNRVFRRMRRLERSEEILDVSTFMVQIWLDEPELGWSTAAVADAKAAGGQEDARRLATSAADELADMCWDVRRIEPPEQVEAEEAVGIVRKCWLSRALGTTVVCDVSDAVGAGAPGENAWILKAFLENDPRLTTYIPLRDAEAVQAAVAAGVGNEIEITVGRKLERRYNTSVVYRGTVTRIEEETLAGTAAVVEHDGIHLILTELPPMVYTPDFFTDLDLRLCRADAVVVKNLFPFRFTFLGVNRKTINVATPGITNIDVFELGYSRIPRPIYPLDDIEDWR
jgi:microcystin degradation protein MlrC